MAAVNLVTLKCKLIHNFEQLILKMSKGYPMNDYKDLIEGIQAVDFIESYDVDNEITIVNYFTNKL